MIWNQQKRGLSATHTTDRALGTRFPTIESTRSNIAKYIELVTYKVEDTDLFVETVNPAYTSQRCSHCGFVHEDNRSDKAFKCLKCEYEVNADYNAAKNVANRYCAYIHRGQKSRGGWATSQLALKSGMLNVNGDFNASPPVEG
ncbi:transposase [Natronorubrum thiooxidans]|uniref:Putative transposase DNA-binding domain-containing protein n=1 Tax=Natronorubrum thiooxidans TaxID=308853 RepID=A0A1N7H9N5_9EURY|nr:Putative transposase DNA-binding domain-containing protein [Natronorubrum thiooxidans]